MNTETDFRLGSTKGSLRTKVSDFLFGLFFYELHQESVEFSRKYRHSIDLLLFAELLGIPFTTSIVTLKLLPYFVGDLARFKKEHLKERDIFIELAERDVH